MKPYVHYGILIWGRETTSHLTKTDKRIKKSMRIMLFKGKHDSVKAFFESGN